MQELAEACWDIAHYLLSVRAELQSVAMLYFVQESEETPEPDLVI